MTQSNSTDLPLKEYSNQVFELYMGEFKEYQESVDSAMDGMSYAINRERERAD